MIRIMLVDDHALLREALGRLLEDADDLRVVGSFDEGSVALAFAAREEPDVAIVDIAMPGASGIDVARQLRTASPATRLLMLSMHARADYVEQALRAGAHGYVVKECAGEEVVAAVRAVHAGRRYLSAGLPKVEVCEDPLDRLSARELEVLKLVVEGKTSLQVATMLGLSPKSIDTYRSRLMAKLDIDHLPALVKFAIRRGLTSV
jgi:DNA-binding NarL/FixJ family response regulator